MVERLVDIEKVVGSKPTGSTNFEVHAVSEDLHPLAKLRNNPPSNEAIAKAFWGRSHCQFHDAEHCDFVEMVVADAHLIDAGKPSHYDFEAARYEALG